MKTYSDHDNVNILTSLLVAHAIKDVIVCPGSRNAPLAHNFEVCPALTVHPVTDERSAGFYALGMALHRHAPIAVCVTSGTALLNLYPAVAEAYYRHVPLIIISADRPAAWIGQLDGQTLPQQGAMGGFVRTSITIAEPHDDEEHWHVNRLINEALADIRKGDAQPVHINVPLAEPLYRFTTPALPEERIIGHIADTPDALPGPLTDALATATHPLLVIGQTDRPVPGSLLEKLARKMALLYEPLSADGQQCIPEDDTDSGTVTGSVDLILYAGDCLVNKRMRQMLRRCAASQVWGLGQGQTAPDPTMHLHTWYPTDDLLRTLEAIADSTTNADPAFLTTWYQSVERRRNADSHVDASQLEACAVKWLESHINAGTTRDNGSKDTPCKKAVVHYANSTAVRLGLRFAHHYIYVNRGVNGIEGCMSTAAGAALAARQSDEEVFLVIGDLSFFYDANALWNTELTGNLHIMLLNNGGGAIFNRFAGLKGSPARERTVMACHDATAQGICESYAIRYLRADGAHDLSEELWHRFTARGSRPVVLEIMAPRQCDND